MISDESP